MKIVLISYHLKVQNMFLSILSIFALCRVLHSNFTDESLCINWPSSHMYLNISASFRIYIIHMGSFFHPLHYFAAAGENDDFVITVINFPHVTT